MSGLGEGIERAVAVLRRGGLVAFPTETVYGLGADATSRAALRRLYEVKGRPPDHPVIVHLGEAGLVGAWAAVVPDAARQLVEACWPGPLTIVVPRAAGVLDEVTGGQDTVALRMPDHPLALGLLRAFGGGVAAPSANRFGRVSPTTADHVVADLGDDVDLVLDGGPCRVGVESTIVDCTVTPPRVLRPGAVSADRVAELTAAFDERAPSTRAVRTPGTLPAHYRPRARVVVSNAAAAGTDLEHARASGTTVGLLMPDPPSGLPSGVHVLPVPADADGYARVLYERLREADRRGLDVVVAVPPPPDGLGTAVRDRLQRASGEEGT